MTFKSFVDIVPVIFLKAYFDDTYTINRKWGQNQLTFLLLAHLFMLTSIVTVPKQTLVK